MGGRAKQKGYCLPRQSRAGSAAGQTAPGAWAQDAGNTRQTARPPGQAPRDQASPDTEAQAQGAHTHTHKHTRTCTQPHTCMHTHNTRHACTHKRVHTCAQTLTCTHMYAHTHAHTHTCHAHTRSHSVQRSAAVGAAAHAPRPAAAHAPAQRPRRGSHVAVTTQLLSSDCISAKRSSSAAATATARTGPTGRPGACPAAQVRQPLP